jgi:ferric-dicitrate binding protein FerR (iron transport regulator)
MTEDTRAQLDIIAQLNDRSVTDEVRHALEAWIERSKSDPKVLERANEVKAEIEREAATKRGAIAAIFDPAPKAKGKEQTSASPARSVKPDA